MKPVSPRWGLAVLMLVSSATSAGGAEAQTRRRLPEMPASEAPVLNRGEDAQALAVAMEAWRRFQTAWSTGEWAPFPAMTTEDFEFYFPEGEFAGLHNGEAGKATLVAWARHHKDAGNRLRAVATRVTAGGDTVVFETAAQSIPPGAYRNYEALVFQVRDGKIGALREYWNVLAPGGDRSGN